MNIPFIDHDYNKNKHTKQFCKEKATSYYTSLTLNFLKSKLQSIMPPLQVYVSWLLANIITESSCASGNATETHGRDCCIRLCLKIWSDCYLHLLLWIYWSQLVVIMAACNGLILCDWCSWGYDRTYCHVYLQIVVLEFLWNLMCVMEQTTQAVNLGTVFGSTWLQFAKYCNPRIFLKYVFRILMVLLKSGLTSLS
jgi:hypothetical protein